MNKIDRRILYELSLNARIPLGDLAKKIRLSPSTTKYRINNLEKEKILLGTQAIIDISKLGFIGTRTYITFEDTTSLKEKEIIDWLLNQKEVSVLTTNTGDIDCITISWTKKRLEFHEFIKRFKEKFHENIKNLEIHNYPKVHHYPRNYLVEEEHSNEIITIGASEEIEKYDELDIDILKLLSDTARMPALEIGTKLNTPAKTIIERIRRMERKQIIKGYSINLNIEKIGYQYEKINILFSKSIPYETLLTYASTIKNTVYVDESTSDYDFELNLEVPGSKERDEIVSDLKNKFGGIRRIQYFKVRKFLKFQYIPD